MSAVEYDVVVVGSGPNGLAAAVTLARAGLSVAVLEGQPTPGGGCRTVELDLGVELRHDLCSAGHPMAAASEFFREFDLAGHGVQLAQPEIAYGHPFDDRPAGVVYRSLERTLAELEPADAAAYRRIIAPLLENIETVLALGLSDQRRVPPEVFTPAGAATAVRFGIDLLGSGIQRRHSPVTAAALLAGVGAHANTPLPSMAAGGAAMVLGTLAHSHGWPMPVGGSQAIVDALIDDLQVHGGKVFCNTTIATESQLPNSTIQLFDTSAWTLGKVYGQKLGSRYLRALQRFRVGSGVSKVDFALREPVPWRDVQLGSAGTVHLGGTRAQIIEAERAVGRGEHSEHPMMLVGQPNTADASRIGPNGEVPLWTYVHVPNGSDRDPTPAVVAQIERFAPGFRDVVIGSRAIPASQMSAHNANYVGGDIGTGAVSLYRMFARPALRWDPYRTPLPTLYLCSAATPPGPGVHGMGGLYAARRILRQHFGIAAQPT